MTKAGMSRITRLIIFLPLEVNYLKKLKSCKLLFNISAAIKTKCSATDTFELAQLKINKSEN